MYMSLTENNLPIFVIISRGKISLNERDEEADRRYYPAVKEKF